MRTQIFIYKNEIKLESIYGISDEDQDEIFKQLIEISTLNQEFDHEEQDMLHEIGNAMGTSRKSIKKYFDIELRRIKLSQNQKTRATPSSFRVIANLVFTF